MTRARQSLSLLAPLRFYVTQQRRDGDRHVYGARSRFVTEALLATMEVSRHGTPVTVITSYSIHYTKLYEIGKSTITVIKTTIVSGTPILM